MARRVGLPAVLADVEPRLFYPVAWDVPDRFTGRGRWSGGPLHTFVDDFRQEFFWRRPQEGLLVALSAGVCTAPDFTVWVDDPQEWAQHQAWRSAVVGAYWATCGVRVLPVVSFGSGVQRYVGYGSTWAVRGPSRRGDDGPWLARLQLFLDASGCGRLVVFGRVPEVVHSWGVPVLARRLVERGKADGGQDRQPARGAGRSRGVDHGSFQRSLELV